MLSSVIQASVLFLAAQASSAALVKRASGVVPLGTSTDVFNEGGPCKASWTPDTSGATTWKSMTIELMTGSNLSMKKLATVASGIDGTSTSNTSYTYQCPSVSPNSAIYFLQYTHGSEQDPTWTTRFAIATSSGKTTTPPQSNQPQGGSPAIPWGNGKLTGSSAGSSTLATSSDSTSGSSSSSGSNANANTSSSGNENASGNVSSSSSSSSAQPAATSAQKSSTSTSNTSTSGATSNVAKGAALPIAVVAGLVVALL